MLYKTACPYKGDQDGNPDPYEGPWCQGSSQSCYAFLDTDTPSLAPSVTPSDSPSIEHTATPSDAPSLAPSDHPSFEPSSDPSVEPSFEKSLQPSEVPPLAPSFSFCIDNPAFQAKGNSKKNCKWIAEKPTKRCPIDSGAEVGCPATCNPGCIGCTDDPDYRYNDNNEKTCE